MDYKRLSAARLRSARNNHGWTLAELARRTEPLTAELISNYEQARRYMPPEVAEQLARALDVAMAWLLGVDGDPLSRDELHLLSLYRNASDSGKHIIGRVAEAQVIYDRTPDH